MNRIENINEIFIYIHHNIYDVLINRENEKEELSFNISNIDGQQKLNSLYDFLLKFDLKDKCKMFKLDN